MPCWPGLCSSVSSVRGALGSPWQALRRRGAAGGEEAAAAAAVLVPTPTQPAHRPCAAQGHSPVGALYTASPFWGGGVKLALVGLSLRAPGPGTTHLQAEAGETHLSQPPVVRVRGVSGQGVEASGFSGQWAGHRPGLGWAGRHLAGRGPCEQLGERSDCRVGHRGTATPWRGGLGQFQPGRGRQLEAGFDLPDRLASLEQLGGSAPATHPSSHVLKAPGGLGDPGPSEASRPLPRDHLSEAGGSPEEKVGAAHQH